MRADFEKTFETIKSMFVAVAPDLVVLHDEPGKYQLDTHEVRKDGYRIWFGGVSIRKNYVSAHVIGVYANPKLRDALSPGLRKRMQGKSCFNFTTIEPELARELAALIKASTKITYLTTEGASR